MNSSSESTSEGQPHAHDLGLSHDLPRLLSRRSALLAFGGVGAALVAGCSTDSPTAVATTRPSSAAASTAAPTTTPSVTTQIPEETGGPFPADGSNGVNVLTSSGVVRSDIRSSFGGLTGTADGVPLTIDLTVLSVSGGGAPLAGAAVYLWHCDAQGRYSLYTQGAEDQNYLRGVQVADSAGRLSFASVFPAAYQGRWPHIHFEVYPSVEQATVAGTKLRTSQLAFPEDVCAQVYTDSRYAGSTQNLSQTSLATDNVFADGYSLQLATMTGTVSSGLTASLNVPV